MILIVGLMASVASGAVDPRQIRFDTMQPTDTLIKTMRGIVGKVNEDLLRSGIADPSGRVYFVDGNKSTAGNGSSWDDAFNTLSAAMAASHADIAVSAYRKWAARNTIFVIADGITEDITKLAQKTDIIGLGSNDAFNGLAKITGSWIIPDTTSYMGCRFYNMYFTDSGATPIWDLDTQNGIEFHNCRFEATALTTIGLQLEECNRIVVNKCLFTMFGTSRAFATACLVVVQDTDPAYEITIANSRFVTDHIGIDWNETATYDCWIRDNYFLTDGMCVDAEDTVGLMVVENRMVTTLEPADNTSNDFNIAYAIRNMVTGASSSLMIPTFSDD